MEMKCGIAHSSSLASYHFAPLQFYLERPGLLVAQQESQAVDHLRGY